MRSVVYWCGVKLAGRTWLGTWVVFFGRRWSLHIERLEIHGKPPPPVTAMSPTARDVDRSQNACPSLTCLSRYPWKVRDICSREARVYCGGYVPIGVSVCRGDVVLLSVVDDLLQFE